MSNATLWAGVVAIGLYHGLNPAMGWPLAVANGLGERRSAAVLGTWLPLGTGHLLAMALVLVPFTLLSWLLQWSREIRIGAGVLVVLFGVARLLWRRHPRWLARIRPSQLALWSFLMATAHGAALMLLPIVMGLCAPAEPAAPDHQALLQLMVNGPGTALAVSLVHTTAMIGSGLGMAWIVYRHLGLQALQATWLDLDRIWALGLIASGLAAITLSPH
ncbi:hypothetical protein [Ideonella sp.]|uniref:hypothetical protein n=1 Tax=Ideonella sp. TaxID=1929293 RepID=UPI0035ADB6D1